MSINVSDQLKLSNLLSLDPRQSNVVLSGSNILVESIWQYLSRVDLGSRYLGLEVLMLIPAGMYSVDSFLQNTQNGNIRVTKYVFSNVSDAGLIPYEYGEYIIIDDLTTGGSTYALSAEQGVVLKALIDSKAGEWGTITGDINNQTDLITLINQNSGGGAWGEITGNIEDQTDLAYELEILKRYNFMW